MRIKRDNVHTDVSTVLGKGQGRHKELAVLWQRQILMEFFLTEEKIKNTPAWSLLVMR